MEYKCNMCDKIFTLGEIYACTRCGSTDIIDRNEYRLNFLSEYCVELEEAQWELEKKIDDLTERLIEIEAMSAEDFENKMIDNIRDFVFTYMELKEDEINIQ